MPRLLFGPADDPAFTDRFLAAPLAAGRWRTFPASCPSWDEAVAGGPEPDALLVWPGYTSVPAWAWSAPVPVVALAHDPNLLWHAYRQVLPLADLVLTDAPSAETMRRAGIGHARAANLYGLDRHLLAALDAPEGVRDVDVLFVGNLSPAVQGDRLPWLGRLARLSARFKVVVAGGVFGADYRALLRRAKLVFNRSARGECNLRALEAAASGAVLLQEAENAEVPLYLAPGAEYAPYTAGDLEAVVERLLADEGMRRGIAARARERARGYAFEALVEAALDVGGPGWEEVRDRAAKRVAAPPAVPLAGRVWVRASLAGPDADPGLAADLDAAGDRHGLAVVAASPAGAEPHLAAAAAGNRVSALGHAAALARLGRTGAAVEVLRGVIAALGAAPELTPAERETVPYPVGYDRLRAGWERAAFDRPDDSDAEGAAKLALLRWRAWSLLGELTGELAAFEAAAAACPHLPAARAALGPALVRAGRDAEAIDTSGRPPPATRSTGPRPPRWRRPSPGPATPPGPPRSAPTASPSRPRPRPPSFWTSADRTRAQTHLENPAFP